MAALGIPRAPEGCDSRYGEAYLARWAATGRDVCLPRAAGDDSGESGESSERESESESGGESADARGQSRVFCAAHPGAELTTCVLRNLVLTDSEAFMGTQSAPAGVVPSWLPSGAEGSVQLACGLWPKAGAAAAAARDEGGDGGADGAGGNNNNGTERARAEALLRRRLDQDGARQWMRSAFPGGGAAAAAGASGDEKGQSAAEAEVAAACSGRGRGGAAIERPVLLLTRIDGLNAFHTVEGLLSVFSALAVAAPEMRRAGILPPSPSSGDGDGEGDGGDDGRDGGGGGRDKGGTFAWAQAEVVLADQTWPGPFLDIWRHLAAGAGGGGAAAAAAGRRQQQRQGRGRRRRDGREASPAPLVRHLASRPFPAGTCLRRAVLLPYTPHGQSLLTYTGVGSDGACGASPVAFGAALWLRHLLRASAPRRGFLLSAAEALERGNEGVMGASHRAEEPFGHEHGRDGVAAPTWFARHEAAAAAAAGTATGAGAGAAASAAGAMLFGRRFGKVGGGEGAAADNVTAPLAPVVPPYAPHLVRLKFLWLSRAHYERHGAGRGPSAGPEASPWQQQRRLSAAAERAAILALQGAVLEWNGRACALADDSAVPASADDDEADADADHDDADAKKSNGTEASAHQQQPCRPLPVLFELSPLELSDSPFDPDQAHALSRAGVLAGVHGAGLANMVLMRPGCGAVVEVWHNMRDNYHYQNMAALLGHDYRRLETGGGEEGGEPGAPAEGVDSGALARAAMAAMDAAAARHAAAAGALLREVRRRRRDRGEAGGRGAFPWGFRG